MAVAYGAIASHIKKQREKKPKPEPISNSTPNLKAVNYENYMGQHTVNHGVKDIKHSIKHLNKEMTMVKEELLQLRKDMQYVVVTSHKATTSHILQDQANLNAKLDEDLNIIKAKLTECSNAIIKNQGVHSVKKSIGVQTDIPRDLTNGIPAIPGPNVSASIPPSLEYKFKWMQAARQIGNRNKLPIPFIRQNDSDRFSKSS